MLMLLASWLKTVFFLLYLFTVVDILELFGRVFLNSPDFETLESRGAQNTRALWEMQFAGQRAL